MLPQLFIFLGDVCQRLGQGDMVHSDARPAPAAAMFPREAIACCARCS